MTHVTRYRNMLLTPSDRGYPRYTKRTLKVFASIGECITVGGKVTMRTWYDGREQRSDITLEWPE